MNNESPVASRWFINKGHDQDDPLFDAAKLQRFDCKTVIYI